jgi:hypothetical protein
MPPTNWRQALRACSVRRWPLLTRPAPLALLLLATYLAMGWTRTSHALRDENATAQCDEFASQCAVDLLLPLMMCCVLFVHLWCKQEPRVPGLIWWVPAGLVIAFTALELVAWAGQQTTGVHHVRFRPSRAATTMVSRATASITALVLAVVDGSSPVDRSRASGASRARHWLDSQCLRCLRPVVPAQGHGCTACTTWR